jgi:hypothetical protein
MEMVGRFILCVTLFLLCQGHSVASEIVPLEKYLQKNDIKDDIVKIYIFNRCTSLFMSFTVAAKNQSSPESVEFTRNARSAYADMTKAAALTTLNAFKDPDLAIEQNAKTVKKLLQVYTDYSSNLMDSGKNLEDDALIGGDMNICSSILMKLRGH